MLTPYEAAVGSIGKQFRYRREAENIEIYIERLEGFGVPPLLDIGVLSELCDVDISVVAGAIRDPGKYYRQFQIPKRRGGVRALSAPTPDLLKCQRWIAQSILVGGKLHEAATAYREGLGLLSNVTPHVNAQSVLRCDLKDFFPSIGIARVVAVFRSFGYLPKMAYELARLCCLLDKLPQGAATSPALSNIIATRMDTRLAGVARANDLNYTRYSDDLTFSGEVVHGAIISEIADIAADEGFSLHPAKTVLVSGSTRKLVTGVSVGGDKPKLPKSKKRAWRQEFYEVLQKRNPADVIRSGSRPVFFLESLLGRMNFWIYLEPDAIFPKRASAEIWAAIRRLSRSSLPP